MGEDFLKFFDGGGIDVFLVDIEIHAGDDFLDLPSLECLIAEGAEEDVEGANTV